MVKLIEQVVTEHSRYGNAGFAYDLRAQVFDLKCKRHGYELESGVELVFERTGTGYG